MRGSDFVVLGLAAFATGVLLGLLLLRAMGGRPVSRLPGAYREWHAGIHEWLERRNVLRIPGAALVDPVRPWLFGEGTALIVLSAAGTLGGGLASIGKAVPAAAALGAGALYLSLRRDARRALLSVRRDLPVACFLLSLLLESGMGPSASLQETAYALPSGPLAGEIRDLVRSRSLGIPREETLDRSGSRVPCEEYRLFLSHIRQGERLGIGLSGSLRELSAKLLESQKDRAEAIAQRAAVKMLAPLVLFIFPAVFLIILSPVLFGLLRGFGG